MTLRRLALMLSALFLVSLLLEAGLEHAGRVKHDARVSPRPSYLWSYYSYSGTQISGGEDGILKLQASPAVGYKNMPNQKTRYFSINSLGYRGPEPARNVAIGRRISLVGGSTAFGTGLDSDSQTFAQQLENKFQGVEVINAAVIGYESGQELVCLVTDLLDRHPDLVVALDGFNDFAETVKPAFGRRPIGFNNFDVDNDDLLEARGLFSRPMLSRIASIHKLLFYKLEENTVESASNIGMALGYNVDRNITIVAQTYIKNVVKMSVITRASHGRFLCVLQRFCPKGKKSLFVANGYKRFLREVKAALKENNISFIDLNDERIYFDQSDFMDSIHLDPHGNARMAEIVSNKIREAGLLSESRGMAF